MSFLKFKKFIIELPRSAKILLVIVMDAVICFLSVYLAFLLRFDWWYVLDERQWLLFAFSISVALPSFCFFGIYRNVLRYIGSRALSSLIQAFIPISLSTIFFFSIVGIGQFPRSIGILQPLLFFIGIVFSRYIVRIWLSSISLIQIKNMVVNNTFIYGAGSMGRQLNAALALSNDVVVKGFFDDDPCLWGKTINGVRVHGFHNFKHLIAKYNISSVLLALPCSSKERRNEVLLALKDLGIRVRNIPSLPHRTSGNNMIAGRSYYGMDDLLGRKAIPPRHDLMKKNIFNKVVLVTGAGGSIGSELCRQILSYSPSTLILFDSSEFSLYSIYEELKKLSLKMESDRTICGNGSPHSSLVAYLGSVRDEDRMSWLFATNQIDTVFHAAAYKHVPLVEENPTEGIRNNVLGTLICSKLSLDHGVSSFILISTDKAVRSTNVMGATKRLAEMVLQAFSDLAKEGEKKTKFSMVRFGNVLGSAGSVVPLFEAQIKAGGPITLTHSEVTRYFMTIPEAAQLVIQASAMSIGGDVFILDMGKPVRIYDLATNIVYLSGLLVKDENHPHGDIEIVVTGLRPGEKLYEELLIGDNPQPTDHPQILMAHEHFLPWSELEGEIERLKLALNGSDGEVVNSILKRLVPDYQSKVGEVNWS